ncbi:MAG: hypothetical protein IPI19_04630 [Ignavibacteriales bacterium]|nr:hypothetical protein [Ignavibacteriales bacterium]
MIIDIANWPDTRIEHWRALLKARAIENQCYVVGVNRVGDDPKLHYNGFSSVFDPMGKEIVAVENEEKVIVAEIDRSYVRKRKTKITILERYEIDLILLSYRKYCKNNCQNFS